MPVHLADTIIVAPPRRRRRRVVRVLRALGIVAVVVLLISSVAGAAVYEDPALLSPVGGALLGTQTGSVPWNGADPINILVAGIDQRTNEQTRTDSMIVMHVDPGASTVQMLSVPRDLWVAIPRYGYAKINAGYALGQPYGQGPQFATFAVESALHIPINYYAILRFNGFKNVVDAMGGINVCVPRELYDTQYPDDTGFGMHTIDIKAGCQTMNGSTALVYARERHANTQQDLGRIEQQQALLSGVEKSLLSPAMLPHVPTALTAMNEALISNLPHGTVPELGVLLGRARGNRTQHSYLNVDGGYVTSGWSDDGQSILRPNSTKIASLVSTVFPSTLLHDENAVVQVLNGQQTSGLAADYTTVLAGIGFNTQAPANSDVTGLQHTIVTTNLDRPGAAYTVRTLTQMLQAVPALAHLGSAGPQVTVTLGADAVWGS